jgi:hypothetical protein
VKLRLRRGSRVELFRDSAVLFSERGQQLHRLEGASVVLALLLQESATFSQLVSEIVRGGREPDVAEQWARTFLDQLAGKGVLETVGVTRPSWSPFHQRFAIGPVHFALDYGTDEHYRTIAPLFEHLELSALTDPHRIQLGEFGANLLRLQEDDDSALLIPRDQLALWLKAILLERLFASDRILVALHAAFLSRGGEGLLVLGSPGAGKSTLSLALLSRGFDYGSDDLTLVDEEAGAIGVAFAPAVKKGAWPIAKELGVELFPASPVVRPDGQQVRFGRVACLRSSAPRSIGLIVSLSRNAGGKPELSPMMPHVALAELLSEARSRSGQCSAPLMSALADLVRGAHSYRLHYSEAVEAADLIMNLTARG